MTAELHLADLILSTVVIIGLLSVSALVCQQLKLPGIVGFIIAGVIIGPDGVAFINSMPGGESYRRVGSNFLAVYYRLGVVFSNAEKKLEAHRLLWFGASGADGGFFCGTLSLGVGFELASVAVVGVFDFVEFISYCDETIDRQS